MERELVKFGIEATGIEETKFALGALVSRIDNLTDVWNEIIEDVYKPTIRRRFQSRGRQGWKSGGFPQWADYANEPKYESRKRGILKVKRAKAGAGLGIGRWGAAQRDPVPGPREWLTASFLGEGQTVGVAYHVRHVGRHSMTIGSRLPWAHSFNSGAPRQPFDNVPQPARPIFVDDRAMVREIALRLQRFIVHKDRAAGRTAFRTGAFTAAQIRRQIG